jgi:hypothetical protein
MIKRAIEQKIKCINETAGAVQISEEDINNDERLAYILRKNRTIPFLSDLDVALQEVKDIQEGKRKPMTMEELLAELR